MVPSSPTPAPSPSPLGPSQSPKAVGTSSAPLVPKAMGEGVLVQCEVTAGPRAWIGLFAYPSRAGQSKRLSSRPCSSSSSATDPLNPHDFRKWQLLLSPFYVKGN